MRRRGEGRGGKDITRAIIVTSPECDTGSREAAITLLRSLVV